MSFATIPTVLLTLVLLAAGCAPVRTSVARGPAIVVPAGLPADIVNTPLALSAALAPYTGPSVQGVDTTTLRGKVMCGYQGWFTASTDGYGRGYAHWGAVDREPPRCSVDLWPDLAECDLDERYPTQYRQANGAVAQVFSSTNRKTVLRHFQWMQQYGIDGVFVQRFTSVTKDAERYRASCAVLHHCCEGANRYGRALAVMYDTSFDRASVEAIKGDWQRLVQEMQLLRTPAYLQHRGAPVVALWGYGFAHRAFDPVATEELLQFFQRPENGGCTIMLGVPNDWRKWQGDTLRLMAQYASIIQPWNVGRYQSPGTAKTHFATYVPGDLAWCRAHDKDYYAVIFPGFSWANLNRGQAPLNAIPRLGGQFLWSQAELVRQYGMDMAYIAMFDEVDEGTAIFKCTNDPPLGRFATYEGQPSDRYLVLAGLAARLLRGERVAYPPAVPSAASPPYVPMPLLQYYAGDLSLTAEQTAALRRAYGATPVAILGTGRTCATWAYALPPVLATKRLDWDAVTTADTLNPTRYPVVVFANGGEDFDAGTVPVARIVRALRDYVQRGGTLVLLSGGRYPMFYPGEGAQAAALGLHLAYLPTTTTGVQVAATAALGEPSLPAWAPCAGLSARLPQRALYPAAVTYRALLPVTAGAPAEALGDAAALVGPGGELGQGRLLYVACDLQQHPQREQLLTQLLLLVAPPSPPPAARAPTP